MSDRQHLEEERQKLADRLAVLNQQELDAERGEVRNAVTRDRVQTLAKLREIGTQLRRLDEADYAIRRKAKIKEAAEALEKETST